MKMETAKTTPRRTVWRITTLGFALLVVGGAATLALAPEARMTVAVAALVAPSPTTVEPAQTTVRGLRVQTVTLAAAVEARSFTGVVVARFQTPLSFRVGGRIATRLVEVGQTVRMGDALMTLDPADLDAGLRAAEANLAAARAQAVQATAEEARQAQLLASGWIAQARYEIAKAAADGAAEAVLAATESVRLARNAQGYATLRAPSGGLVTAISAEAGQVWCQRVSRC